MPSWCENDLIVRGDKEELKKFEDFVAGNDEDGEAKAFTYMKVIPRPKEEDKNWYAWNSTNWGCKWDVTDATFERKRSSLFYTFCSPWSPPVPVIRKLGTLFPKLYIRLEYFEGGVGYSGRLVYDKGVEVEDSYNNGYRGGRGG